MQGEIQQEQWQAYLDGFSKRNSGRTALFMQRLKDIEIAISFPWGPNSCSR